MAPIECRYPKGLPVQGSNERIAYRIDVSTWSKSLSACKVTEVIDESDGSNVMSAAATGLTSPWTC